MNAGASKGETLETGHVGPSLAAAVSVPSGFCHVESVLLTRLLGVLPPSLQHVFVNFVGKT